MDQHNANSIDKQLNELDKDILETLKHADKGMRANTIRKGIKNWINAEKYYRSIARLQSLQYIVRTEYKASVYYSITLTGRAVLDELNEILISLVHKRPL